MQGLFRLRYFSSGHRMPRRHCLAAHESDEIIGAHQVELFQERQNLYPVRYLTVSEKIPIEAGLSRHTAGSGSAD